MTDEPRHLQQEREIADLIRGTGGEWNEILVHVCATVATTQISISADVRLPRGPKGLAQLIGPLRRSMADPVRGAWLMADIVVPRESGATFSYDWMSKPDWPGTGGTFSDFDDVGYLEDLNEFPRLPEHLPDWYPDPETTDFATAYADAPKPDAPTPPPLPQRGSNPDELLIGLDLPFGVTVDAAGDLYVTDADRVVVLRAGAERPELLPLSGLREPCGVAVDDSGAVYVADSLNNRVVVVDRDSSDPHELPLPDLDYPGGIAIDSAGTLYVTDRGRRQVLALTRGATKPAVLPFTGLRWLIDVAVDDTGAVYVADRASSNADPAGGRVLKLDADANQPTEICDGLTVIGGIAVDSAENLYITEKVADGRVLKLSAGAFGIVANRLHHPTGLAVDRAGTVYVAEAPPEHEAPFGGQVLKLANP